MAAKDVKVLVNEALAESAFSLWCATKEKENELAKAEARRVRRSQGSPLIVVVDDEHAVAITLTEVLIRHGLNAVWFTESLSALDYIGDGPLDLLVSDITMPFMDGILLASQVHALHPQCGIFLFSAIIDAPDIIRRISETNMEIHLEAKPLRVPHLVSTIDRLLTRTCLAT